LAIRNFSSKEYFPMRLTRLTALTIALFLPAVTVFVNTPASAQSNISGDIEGSVADPSGAAVPGAKVTLRGDATGSVNTDTTNSAGSYHFSLLKPGSYTVTVAAQGFDQLNSKVVISQGTTVSSNFKLTVGQATTVVEVNGDETPMLQTSDAQLSTTFSEKQIQTLPNPGGDITYYAQTAPGVVMNTAGGDGNFSVFGLPGTSNNYTVNGEQENDPFLNLNNSGPTNLLLGQNDISAVTVLTSAYGAEFGSFGGAQINETSRSGGNHFHGDASYFWNGDSLNANEWFHKSDEIGEGLPNTRPFSNDNQWSAAIGGPIVKNKTFFFVDTEGIRFITSNSISVFIPSTAYQAGILGSDGNCDNNSSSLFANNNGSECAFYKQFFSIYNNAPGAANALQSPNGGDSASYNAVPATAAHESLLTVRVDQVFNAKDSAFAHFKYDNGEQPTESDPLSPVFDAVSKQPAYEGQLVENHVFSSNIVNQFVGSVAHYVALFTPSNQAGALAAFPYNVAGFDDEPFTAIGNILFAFPEGRNATQYQFADDFSWTKKAHTMKFGYAFKKDDISDFDPEEFSVFPEVVPFSCFPTGLPPCTASESFVDGNNFNYIQSFPSHPDDPIGLYSEGFYASDTWKATSKLTITYGIRFEHNSDPVAEHDTLSRLNESVQSYLGSAAAANETTPYTSVLAFNQNKTFPGFERISPEPRFEVAYSLTPKTVIRGGYGMFSDVFPGTVADALLANIPQDPTFTIVGGPFAPGAPTSPGTVAAASAAAFSSAFVAGGSFSSISATVPAFSAPSIVTPASNIQYPTYQEFSLQIQQALNKNTSIQIAYVGNHGYHEPVEDGSLNAFATNGSVVTSTGGTFTGFPATAPSTSFGQITNVSSNASSNYNGGSFSIIHHSKWVMAQLNYTYSHALDQISNGGFLVFNATSSMTSPIVPGSLADNYGNADEDIRNSLNGNYLITIPGYGNHALRIVTDGWELAGTVFYRSGFPFTVLDTTISGQLTNYAGGAGIPAAITNPSLSRHCGPAAAENGAGGGTPCLAVANFADPTGFIPNQRNAFYGPHYFNTDLTLNKTFKLPAGIALLVGANGYNILNHPNFANPAADFATPATFGFSESTVSVPTSIYGSGLGASASPRILQLHAKVTF
jgi:hypothetical protein